MALLAGQIVLAQWKNGQQRPAIVLVPQGETTADVVFFLIPEDGGGGGAQPGYNVEVTPITDADNAVAGAPAIPAPS